MVVLTYLTRTQTFLCATWLYLTAFGILGHDSYHQRCNSATSQGTGLLDLPLCRLSSLGLILRRLIDWPHRWSSMCSCHYLLLVEITAKGTADAFLRRPTSSSSSSPGNEEAHRTSSHHSSLRAVCSRGGLEAESRSLCRCRTLSWAEWFDSVPTGSLRLLSRTAAGWKPTLCPKQPVKHVSLTCA